MSDLHQRFWKATRDEHQRLEGYPYFEALVGARLPLSSYVAWLRIMTVLVGVLEETTSQTDDARLRDLWRPEMRKLPLLQADAAVFDDEPSVGTAAVPPALELVEALRSWGRHLPLKLVGALYVFEGSVLGGRVMRDKLADQYGLEEAGLSYVSAYGRRLSALWSAFCGRLDSLELDEAETAQAVQGAVDVFAALGRVIEHLYPVRDDAYAVVQALNTGAGRHEGTSDLREVLAAIDAGVRTLIDFPYLAARYGERGRRFTRSDSAWLVLQSEADLDTGFGQVEWLSRVLAHRGMPSVVVEHHLLHLQEALTRAIPERAERYRRLAEIGERLRSRRISALPAFEEAVRSFRLSKPIGNIGPILAGAVADRRLGVDNAVSSVESWLTDRERFPPDWIEAVKQTITDAEGGALATP